MTSLRWGNEGIKWYDWFYLIPLFIFYPIINMFIATFCLIKSRFGTEEKYPVINAQGVKWYEELMIWAIIPIYLISFIFLTWITCIAWICGASKNEGGCPHYRMSECDCKP